MVDSFSHLLLVSALKIESLWLLFLKQNTINCYSNFSNKTEIYNTIISQTKCSISCAWFLKQSAIIFETKHIKMVRVIFKTKWHFLVHLIFETNRNILVYVIFQTKRSYFGVSYFWNKSVVFWEYIYYFLNNLLYNGAPYFSNKSQYFGNNQKPFLFFKTNHINLVVAFFETKWYNMINIRNGNDKKENDNAKIYDFQNL